MSQSPVEQTPLAIARKKRGWTQAYVAEKVGVSIDAVRRWESGRLPYPASIQKLCRLFAMSLQELGLFTEQRLATVEGRGPVQPEKQMELVTRVSMTWLEGDEGLLREALSSFYTLFQTTRAIIALRPTMVGYANAFAKIAGVSPLNDTQGE